MNLTEFSLKNRVVTWLAVVLMFLGGLASYEKLGKLEDPEFTVKTAMITTSYPGASPEQVEREVTDVIETALQEIPELDYLESDSRYGLSIVKVEIKSEFWSDKLPQIWDTLRRKIRNIENSLPIGAGRPSIGDDFGDVYGFVIAVTGDGYSYKELEDNVKTIKRKLSLVDGVARVEYWGKRNRAVYLKVSETALANRGVTPTDITAALLKQNTVTASGNVYHNKESSRIEITGGFVSAEDVGELTVRPSLLTEMTKGTKAQAGELLKIKDIAEVKIEFIEPSPQVMRHNGEDAIGLSISNITGSNIIKLGDRLEKRVAKIEKELPVGIEVHKVAWQSNEVSSAIDNFVISLIEAVLIVLVVLTVTMGWRMGVIIGTALVMTIMGTMIFLVVFEIDLQRMSLGALVIALGMMVDNSIVVADGIAVRIQNGMDKVKAAIEAATKPSIPLLGATVIAVLAFYPIGGSTDSTGEYCQSLFQVVGISLMFSWFISMTLTPLQCIQLLKVKKGAEDKDPYDTPFFRGYKYILEKAIRFRVLTLASMVGMLAISIISFQNVPQTFFPDSSRNQFMVDMFAKNGTRVPQTSELIRTAEQHIMKMDGVKSVSSFIASGPPRFYLPVEPERYYTSYGQLIVTVDDYRIIDGLIDEVSPWLKENMPEVPVFRPRKYAVGPAETWKFEIRLIAPSDAELHEIRSVGEQGLAILQGHPMVEASQLDWREPVPKVVIDYDQDRGRWASVARTDVAEASLRAFDGLPVGQFREGDNLLPILLRNKGSEREDASSIYTVQIPQFLSTETVPLSQVAASIDMEWEAPYIWRRDRQRMVTIQAAPKKGVTLPSLREDLSEQLLAYHKSLPAGYELEWGGETESSADAQAALIPGFIPALILMFFMIVALFNSMKPGFIIFLTVPLAGIGVTAGLLSTGQAFGFMALLGAMSLMGMMIKNAIVLIDEIKLNREENNQNAYDAIVNAGVSRLRPVALAAATTVLGVIPLIQDVFWVSMAVTIMAGLAFGTVLTMVVVPVLYATFYNVKK